MTPKEYADDLVERFHEHSYNPSPFFNTSEEGSHDKQCALICISEIKKSFSSEITEWFCIQVEHEIRKMQ